MNGRDANNFLYLNREGRWLDFKWKGLELGEDGALRLAWLPLPADGFPVDLSNSEAPDGPGGVAAAPDGAVYYSDTQAHRIGVIDCDGSQRPLPCLGGVGDRPTRLHWPRGLIYHPGRDALIVADSGNHRLQLFSLQDEQLIDVWSGPGRGPGRVRCPVSLSLDEQGNLYVVDRGNRRVQKFDPLGRVIASFWKYARAAASLSWPAEVAVARGEVFVLNVDPALVAVFDAQGRHLRDIALPQGLEPMGFWVDEQALYLGDNARGRLIKLTRKGVPLGEAVGYQGPVAAIAGDCRGGLWLHPNGGERPLKLETGKAFLKSGQLWGGPFGRQQRLSAWHRLQALGRPLDAGLHFRFFVHSSDLATPPPPAPTSSSSFDPRFWKAMPPDVPDLLVNAESRFVWIGALLEGEGNDSPRLEQMRLDFDHQSYTRHLPALYQKKSPRPRQLEGFLSLFESFFVDAERAIGRLDRLFDAQATPSPWLDWLAGWLGQELDEEWPEERKRRAIQQAFAAFGQRGTLGGLRRCIRFETGVEARIEEPLLQASWWSLPAPADSQARKDASRLGFTTRLVSAQAQGAVLGTSAVLDRSPLIGQEEFGAPLFRGLAHRFSVFVHRAQVADPRRLEEVKAVIEREKPAHTDYQLCLIEPRLSIGLQARIGVDTVVGGPLAPSHLGLQGAAQGTVLAGQPAGRMGMESRIGKTTRLGGGAHSVKQHCGEPKPAC